MSEEPGPTPLLGVQPYPRSVQVASQSFELLHGPPHEMLVDAPGKGVQPRAVEAPVVVDPASHLRVDGLSEARQVRPAATIEVPGPDLQTFRLQSLGAYGRREAHEEAPSAPHEAPPEGVAEEVKAGALRVTSAVRVLGSTRS